MISFDAVVVGAGPAGSTCAHRLKLAGLNVKILDKKVFPRVKPCAGWITPQVLDSLDLDIDDYRGRSRTLQAVTGFRTGVIGGRVVETNYSKPVSFGIRRNEFDDFLLKRSGVACEFQAVNQIWRENGAWKLNGIWTTPLLIGAGGHFCPVARMAYKEPADPALQTRQNSSPVVYAQEAEFEISPEQQCVDLIDPQRPELYFCRDFKGYGWCFRKGRFLNIGLGRVQKTNLTAQVESFCDFLRSRKILIDELPPRFLGHAYRLYAGSSPRLYGDGFVLVGDSAGLAYPLSGEGIRPAVESALIASDVIAKANGSYHRNSLAAYEQRLIRRLGPPKPASDFHWLPMSWLHNIAAGLMSTRWFARKTVIENWFLHKQQSALKI